MSLCGSLAPCSGLACVAGAQGPCMRSRLCPLSLGLGQRASIPRPQLRGSPTGNRGHDCFLFHVLPRNPLSSSLTFSSSCSFSVLSFSILGGPHPLTCFNSKETKMLRPPSCSPMVAFLFWVLGKFLNLCSPQYPHLKM